MGKGIPVGISPVGGSGGVGNGACLSPSLATIRMAVMVTISLPPILLSYSPIYLGIIYHCHFIAASRLSFAMAESKSQMNNDDSSSAALDRLPTHGDTAQLESLGFHSELQRTFSLPSIVGLCLCLMSTWEACAAVLVQGLASGGAPCLFYNL